MGDGIRVYDAPVEGVMISSPGGWFPGIYDTEETARAALAAGETSAFLAMQRRVNHRNQEDRPITLADLASVGESHA